jgi:DNA-binding LytR/AlgR family response regulator
MKVLLIEDEKPAARQLEKLLRQLVPEVQVLAVIESVEQALRWFHASPDNPELIFMDIQLADGLSFDIFQEVQVEVPVIFTTAFNQYTLQAFKVNSIDYLLKPIDPEELEKALKKYRQYYHKPVQVDYQTLLNTLQERGQTSPYKQRFLIKSGQELKMIPRQTVQFFFSEDGLVFAQVDRQKKYILDYTLEQLEDLVPPSDFFRINRKMILQLPAIRKIHNYFNGRLKLDIEPAPEFDVIVSRDRVSNFKQWLDQ